MTYKHLKADNSHHDSNDFKSIRCKWVESDPPEPAAGQVLIKVHYSSMNYKDALAVTGGGKILRSLPLTPGIDASGIVAQSKSDKFKEGDSVFITGCGLGESINGAYGNLIAAPENITLPLPKNLSLKDIMILGTAGFTAGLALHQLEKNDLTPEKGPVLITGATGGVGSLSLILLKKKGYELEAWTRKSDQLPWLKNLGASTVKNIKNQDWQTRPLESGAWGAAIDNVGGDILSYILPRINPYGSLASIGLAMSPQLNTSVFPFILRGVNLLGASSTTCPLPLREKVWNELSSLSCDWNQALTTQLKPNKILDHAKKMITGTTTGRTLIHFT